MFLYVTVTKKESYYTDGISTKKAARMEQISNERCVIIPFEELTAEIARELCPSAIILSGFGGTFESYDIKSFFGINEVLHSEDIPVLAICGSFQLLEPMFSSNITKLPRLYDTPIRHLTQNDTAYPRFATKYGDTDLSHFYMADGFFPITRVKDDALFLNLPETIYVRCNHYCEMKTLPLHFVRLAKSAHSHIEAIRHETRPIYGLQFHPECYEEPFLDGYTILQNFFNIAKEYRKK